MVSLLHFSSPRMFDKVLVFLLIACAGIFLWLTMSESQKLTTNQASVTTGDNMSKSPNLAPLPTSSVNQSTPTIGDDFSQAFERAKKIGITDHQDIASFRPNDFLSRGEFAKMMVTFVASEDKLDTSKRNSDCLFYDYKQAGNYGLYIYDACNNELMKGSNGYFYPNNHISRAEAITSIIRFKAWKKLDESINPRFTNYILNAQENKYINPVNDLNTQLQKMIRKDAISILRRVKTSK